LAFSIQHNNNNIRLTTRVIQYQKGKTNLDFTEARDSGSSGVSWAIRKSAPWPGPKPVPAPHHSVFKYKFI